MPNRALVISDINKIGVQEWPFELEVVDGIPVIPEGKVLVRVKVTGICGSDVSSRSCLVISSQLERYSNIP